MKWSFSYNHFPLSRQAPSFKSIGAKLRAGFDICENVVKFIVNVTPLNLTFSHPKREGNFKCNG